MIDGAPNRREGFNELRWAGLIESRPGVGTVVVADSVEAVREHGRALYERIGCRTRRGRLVITEDELVSASNGSSRASKARASGGSDGRVVRIEVFEARETRFFTGDSQARTSWCLTSAGCGS